MKKGFTLIELICCISIITIISSIALYLPVKKTMKNSAFRAASNELLFDLKNAKMRAIDHGWMKVRFNDDGYMIYELSKYDYRDNVIKIVKFENNIIFDRVNSTVPVDQVIAFTQIGRISPYPCTVAICDDAGNKALITIKVGSFTIDYKR